MDNEQDRSRERVAARLGFAHSHPGRNRPQTIYLARLMAAAKGLKWSGADQEAEISGACVALDIFEHVAGRGAPDMLGQLSTEARGALAGEIQSDGGTLAKLERGVPAAATVPKHRGHPIETGPWVYSDTRELVADNPDRPCGHCGLPNTPEGHDGCLGTIAGAMNACCGHGDQSAAYVQTWPSAPGTEQPSVCENVCCDRGRVLAGFDGGTAMYRDCSDCKGNGLDPHGDLPAAQGWQP